MVVPVRASWVCSALVIVFAGCSGTPSYDDVESLRDAARLRHEMRWADGASVTLESTTRVQAASAEMDVYKSRVMRRGEQWRIETWRDSAESSGGYVELGAAAPTKVWISDKFGRSHEGVEGALLHRRLDRWFDLSLLDGATLGEPLVIDERRVLVVDVPADIAFEAAGLEFTVGIRSVDRLWVDADSLTLARLDGTIAEPGDGEARELSLQWSDFRSGEADRASPLALEMHLDGVPVSSTNTTSVDATSPLPDGTFDPADIVRMLDDRGQVNNELSIETYIAAGTDDGTETEDPDSDYTRARDRVFDPDGVVEQLGLKDGDVVADIGAGTGYFTFRLARAVGPTGTAFAVDVNPHAVQSILGRRYDRNLNPHGNIKGIVNTFDDAKLGEDRVDLAFLCWVFFHRYENLSENNVKMLRSIYRACRPGGRVAIIEELPKGPPRPVLPTSLGWIELPPSHPKFPGEKAPPPPPNGEARPARSLDKLTPMARQIVANYESVGFVYESQHDTVALHDFVVLRKPAE